MGKQIRQLVELLIMLLITGTISALLILGMVSGYGVLPEICIVGEALLMIVVPIFLILKYKG